MCIAPDSPMDVCLNSVDRLEQCVNVVLNYTVQGGPKVMTYSYNDNEDHWTMRSWGPSVVDCVPPRELL